MWGQPSFLGRYNHSDWIFNNSDYISFQHSVTLLNTCCLTSCVGDKDREGNLVFPSSSSGRIGGTVDYNQWSLRASRGQHQPAFLACTPYYMKQTEGGRLSVSAHSSPAGQGQYNPPHLWNSGRNDVTLLPPVTWHLCEGPAMRDSSMSALRLHHSCSLRILSPHSSLLCSRCFFREPRPHRQPKTWGSLGNVISVLKPQVGV